MKKIVSLPRSVFALLLGAFHFILLTPIALLLGFNVSDTAILALISVLIFLAIGDIKGALLRRRYRNAEKELGEPITLKASISILSGKSSRGGMMLLTKDTIHLISRHKHPFSHKKIAFSELKDAITTDLFRITLETESEKLYILAPNAEGIVRKIKGALHGKTEQ
ncbi:MAG: hypothetical protein J6D00_07710 [Christensenellaceae bacterium]|nr:hypothetical protein [Christensenellaceae bacterium]